MTSVDRSTKRILRNRRASPDFENQMENPAFRAGSFSLHCNNLHVFRRLPNLHQTERRDGGFKEVVVGAPDGYPVVELPAEADLNLILMGVEEQGREPVRDIGHVSALLCAEDDDVADEKVASQSVRIEEPPQARRSSVDRQPFDLAVLVRNDHQWVTFELDCFDVPADCRLVVGEILELDFLERHRCLVWDDDACDHE